MPDIPPLSASEIHVMRERCEKATPGPWEWFGMGTKSMIDMNLRSTARGYHVVMDFVRLGMDRACPRFNDGGVLHKCLKWAIRPKPHHEWEIRGIDHPDARFIAASRTDVPRLLDELEMVRRLLANMLKEHDEWYDGEGCPLADRASAYLDAAWGDGEGNDE